MRTTLAVLYSTLLTCALLAAASPAAGQESCNDCHDAEVAEASVHFGFECTDCHSDVDLAELPHSEDLLAGTQICAQCHDAGSDLESSIHADVAACTDCHGTPHGILPVADSASPASVRKQPETCGQCHEAELVDAYVTSVHGDALLKSGLAVAPSCSGCHGAHDIQTASDPQARVSFERTPETCGQCHRFILEDWTRGAHGLAWKTVSAGGTIEGENPVPVCSTCHASHRIMSPRDEAARLSSPDLCAQCHGGRFHTYSDSFHGQATSLGFVLAANCADCHTPHVNLAADNPDSSVNPAHLAATCGQCHGEVSPGFLTFKPHSDPSDPMESHPAVHWIYWFMTGLLLFVFSFFGLHTVLWLQRALVGWARGELQPESTDGPWVKRFSRFHRGTHLAIILSFLTLAATGLPLKFHYTEWAQALSRFPYWFEAAHVIHRMAAVVTFGYALAHVGFIFRRSVLQRQGGLLWGWKSMVPRLSDLGDMLANLRYFLYLGPRPKFDRWTYWEKFDYFAVFWGVPIIGFSGLMLWFPQLFTAFLPGWVLNAAWVIHSDEALLATGFIFIFHFFHTHLRPEAFPMDPVMFVGAMPLARFEEERPLEYRRMVERGELEANFVDPPGEEELLRARIFGFSAVIVGLLLAVGILVGVFLA